MSLWESSSYTRVAALTNLQKIAIRRPTNDDDLSITKNAETEQGARRAESKDLGGATLASAKEDRSGPTRQDIRRSRRGPRIGNDEGSREFTVFRGSIARPLHSLSTLRPGDCSTRTQDSLPAAARSTGRDWLPAGFQRKVSELLLTSHPPFPSLPDAMPTQRLTPACRR